MKVKLSRRIFVSDDTSAVSVGADAVATAVQTELQNRGMAMALVRNGSRGLCWLEPLVEVEIEGERHAFGPVSPMEVPALFETAFSQEHKKYVGLTDQIPYLARQSRVTFARLDGEVARLGGKTSPWGHRYDLVSDALCNALAFLGLGVGLRGGEFGVWAPVMGLVAGLAIATILWMVVRMELRHGVHAGELGTTAGFDPDDGMLAVPVLVWLGMSDWLLAAACLGAPAFAIYLAIKFRNDS